MTAQEMLEQWLQENAHERRERALTAKPRPENVMKLTPGALRARVILADAHERAARAYENTLEELRNGTLGKWPDTDAAQEDDGGGDGQPRVA